MWYTKYTVNPLRSLCGLESQQQPVISTWLDQFPFPQPNEHVLPLQKRGLRMVKVIWIWKDGIKQCPEVLIRSLFTIVVGPPFGPRLQFSWKFFLPGCRNLYMFAAIQTSHQRPHTAIVPQITPRPRFPKLEGTYRRVVGHRFAARLQLLE